MTSSQNEIIYKFIKNKIAWKLEKSGEKILYFSSFSQKK